MSVLILTSVRHTFYQKCQSVIQSVMVGFCMVVVFELNVNFFVLFLLGDFFFFVEWLPQ